MASYALRCNVVPRCAVERRSAQRSYRTRPTRHGVHGMTSLSMVGSGFHARTVNRIGNPNAGAYGHGLIVLDHSHERAPVRDVRHPIFEAVTKNMGVVVADHYGRRAGR